MPPVAFPSPTRMSGRKAMNEEQIRVAWDNMPCLELTESSNQHTRSCDSQGLELDANPSKRKSKWGIQCATPWEIRPAQVIEGKMFVGNLNQATNAHVIEELGVTHIVNASRDHTNPFQDRIQYHSCSVHDSETEDIAGELAEAYDFIEAAFDSYPSAVVLVHCAHGISRSVALVTGYLMRKFGLTFHESLAHIRSRHPAACPNIGFVAQLMSLQEELRIQTCGEHMGEQCGKGLKLTLNTACLSLNTVSWNPNCRDLEWPRNNVWEGAYEEATPTVTSA